MKKKIIALAIAAAVSAPAFADNANVTVYGKAILDLESVNNDKAAPTSAMRVQTNASRLGFKGKEDLGDGLEAFYQYEVQLDADGNSGNGAGNGTRNSAVGLNGGFGSVQLGYWDTPFKVAHNKIELFDNATVFTSINLIGRAGGNAVNYNTRQKNDLLYTSPSLGGVKVAVSYAPNETPTATANLASTSIAATYDEGDIYVAAAMDSRPDSITGGGTLTDSATRLVARYTMGDLWVGATVENITVNNTATTSYSQANSELAAQYKMGANSIGLSYAIAGATATASTGANQLSLRYGMNLSKRAEFFVAYTALSNDSAGTYGFNGGSAFGSQAGSKQSAVGTGLIVSF